jgi:hypothetical protein
MRSKVDLNRMRFFMVNVFYRNRFVQIFRQGFMKKVEVFVRPNQLEQMTAHSFFLCIPQENDKFDFQPIIIGSFG